ncbi:X-ray radiation resistance-associated protein 1 isoform X2 [Gouania willdenowi]|uniref:X-ray radiation resistance-associated protein 1 n=1 Tax=Gouania willdenowi TaxID=441366 RepID=A0A8C5DED1_GOUWI|nr:X-ray radiation resistance-associated protein 1 isoform X2 [Gouania willdenowi]
MNSATFKLDNSQSFPTQCFRHRQSTNGASHWLVAHRNAEELRHRNVQRKIKKNPDSPDSFTLDRLLLLQLHCVDKPSDLCSVDVSERKLNAVKREDFIVFDNVTSINASVNSLSLGSFNSFVSLRKLNLALNGIHNLSFNAEDFHHLKVLDLSYNSVAGEAVVALGQLPVLKVLHLTGNQLRRLPPDLTSSNIDLINQSAEENHSLFKSLEELMLDDNKLSSEVFISLKGLKRLRYINLSGNLISKIPCMQLVGSESADSSDNDMKILTQILQQENWEEFCKGNTLPLPELHFLNLSNNKILTEEMLIGAALFPTLREIHIHSNPVASQRKGTTPLLSHLQDKLGITIRTDESMHSKWKAEERNPKMSTKADCVDKASVVVRKPQDIQSNAHHIFITEAENEFPMATNTTTLMDVQQIPDALESVGTQTAFWMLKHKLNNLHVYRDSKPKLDGIQTAYTQREKRIKDLPPLKRIKHPTERLDEMIEVIRGSRTVTVAALDTVLHSSSTDREGRKEATLLLRDVKTKYKKLHENVIERTAGSDTSNRNEHEEQTVEMNELKQRNGTSYQVLVTGS